MPLEIDFYSKRERIMIIRLFLITVLYIQACHADEGGVACVDREVFCEESARFCHLVSLMRQVCRRTCGICKPITDDSSQDSRNKLLLECEKCEQECKLQDGRAICFCRNGYELASDKKSCKDPRNELLLECEKCEQECKLQDGRAVCFCRNGYELASDKKSCKDIDECLRSPCLKRLQCVNTDGSYSCIRNVCPTTPRNYQKYYGLDDGCCKNSDTKAICGRKPEVGRGPLSFYTLWQWMVYIEVGDMRCVGALLSDTWVVTPADCIGNFEKGHKLHVILGGFGRFLPTARSVVRRHAVKVMKHENHQNLRNNVAVMKLNEPVNQPISTVSPICLPNGEVPPIGVRCYSSGYKIGSHGVELQSTRVQILGDDACKEVEDGERKICVEILDAKDGKKFEAFSGGILFCQRCDSCDWFIAGISTEEIMDSKRISYQDMEYFEEWIADHTEDILVTKKGCLAPEWSEWGEWSACSSLCGGGIQSRERTCVNGAIGLPGCLQESNTTRECNIVQCCSDHWTEWSDCSVSCGGGNQSRRSKSMGWDCIPTTEQQKCNEQRCPKWGYWSKWTPCASLCDGKRSRFRGCIGGKAGDDGCLGADSESENCEGGDCAKWTDWSAWTECSATCGDSLRTQTRTCISLTPEIDCTDLGEKVELCDVEPCFESPCVPVCKELLLAGYCRLHDRYMDLACGEQCCEMECRDLMNCELEDLYTGCQERIFFAKCLWSCSKC